jgi:hypothetical protein
MRHGRRRPLAALLASVGLAGCIHQVDEMRLRLDQDRHGLFTISGSTPFEEVSDGSGNSSSDKKAALFQQKLKACGLTSSLYTKQRKLHVNARMAFATPEELVSAVQCAPTQALALDLNMKRDEGILWTTYTTRLTLAQPLASLGSDHKPQVNGLFDFPRSLVLSVPGTIRSVDDKSGILGMRIATATDQAGDVTTRLAPDSAAASKRAALGEQARRRFEQGALTAPQVPKVGTDALDLTIVSYERKYQLQHILSLLSIAFGSGILLEVIRRLRRRREPPPPPPASASGAAPSPPGSAPSA